MMETKKAVSAIPAARTISDSRLRKLILARLLSSPLTLLPILAGASTILAIWALGISSGLAVFAGIACVLGAVGGFFTRLLLGSESLGKEVIEEMQEDARKDREKELDELDHRLSADGDPRTEHSLRDLRELVKAFYEGEALTDICDAQSSFDILTGVEDLFNQCILYLVRTLELWHTARKTSNPGASRPILKQRERIIAEVDKSIKKLGKILAGIKSFDGDEGLESSGLARIRDELDQNLEVARHVKERMNSLDRELSDGGVAL